MNSQYLQETTIRASDIEIDSKKLETQSGKDLLEKLLTSEIESSSLHREKEYLFMHEIVIGTHPFLFMLQKAFNWHKPIYISPDNLWMMICQGVAQHIKLHSETLRNRLVEFEGQKTIQIRKDSFVPGNWNNPWEEVFPEFSSQIREYLVDDAYPDLVLHFSTSTIKESTAFEICFMDAMSNFFQYEFVSMCGIPEIILKGKKADYEKILTALEKLRRFELDEWMDELSPIMKKIIASFEEPVDQGFWQSIYKENQESGGPYITGWITNFFPYLRKRNEQGQSVYWQQFKGDQANNLKLDNFPSGISKVPFKWQYIAEELNMNFIAGFMGITEDQKHRLETEINWLITHTPKPVKKKSRFSFFNK